MNQIPINTSQNVNIDFNIASIGDRMLAFIIDMILKALFVIIIFYILAEFFNFESYFRSLDKWSIIAVISIITLPIHFYTLVCESLMEGQTIGKKLRKIRVIKIDGYQASFVDYLIRWIFRLIDIAFGACIVGITSMIVTKNTQRLGGLASGTAVISLKNKVTINHTILEEIQIDYQPTFPQVLSLSDNDVRIIKENYLKATQTHDKEIYQKLSEKIRTLLQLEGNKILMTDKQFIKTIILDYNFYTGKEN